MIHVQTKPVPASILAKFPNLAGKTIKCVVADQAADYADVMQADLARVPANSFWGRETGSDILRFTRDGDVSRVAASDSMLAQMEQYEFSRPRPQWETCRAGSVPNVPAYLAGSPASMLRRSRELSSRAPVAVVVDLVSSGAISARLLEKRGAAILAFVRAISMQRPVELWAANYLQANQTNASLILARIETAPLDLARAAFILGSAAYSRGLLYEYARKHHAFNGAWPFANEKTRATIGDAARLALPHITDIVAIEAPYGTDDSFTNPEKWIADQLAALDAMEQQAA